MASLKLTLQNYIKDRYPQEVSYNEIIDIARKMGRKESNAERRLRNSDSPMIETIYRNNCINAYKYKMDEKVIENNINWRMKLLEVSISMGCFNAEDVLAHILNCTGLVFKESKEVDNEKAKFILTEFNLNKAYKRI